jgi:hypothetical protein
MANIFKSNSRFSSLIDDVPLNANVNNNKQMNTKFVIYKGMELNSFKTQRLIKETLNLTPDQFPDLSVSVNSKKTTETIALKYIDTLKKVDDDNQQTHSIDSDLENLKPGCVLLKRDPLTGRTVIKQHPETCFEQKKKKEKTENEIAMDIINMLVDSYNKRTQEYIDNYGYEEWERKFKFPNWREEEAYLERMDEMLYNTYDDDNEPEDNYDDMYY